jgi:hypothetical protein
VVVSILVLILVLTFSQLGYSDVEEFARDFEQFLERSGWGDVRQCKKTDQFLTKTRIFKRMESYNSRAGVEPKFERKKQRAQFVDDY